MSLVRLIFSVCLIVFQIYSLEAIRFQNGFINGTPLRDHYARQIIGLDAVQDCMKNPGKYNVNIWNFTQPVDHFNPGDTRTWSQQVQQRSDHYKNASVSGNDADIVFLLIGGEDPVPTYWMCSLNYTWTQLAVEHGAFMFQLEHRYFGTSTPTANMSVENLKWLTIEQAMADINNFIPAMNKKFSFSNPRWVAFGGSYPGTIAALLRVVYPNITNGNIASSAPLWAKVDFWEYTQKVEQAILWESQVNKNNAACYNNTRDAFEYIRTSVYTESGRNELNRVFNVQPPLGSNMSTIDFDSTNFFANLIGIINVIDQYSFDDRGPSTINSSGLSIANFCGFMIDPKANHTERLYNVYAWYYSWNGISPPPPSDNDYWSDMDYFRDVSFQSGGAAYRGWVWLLCNEFGWLPTTDFGYGIFQDLVPLSYYMKYCEDMFDTTINNDYIETNIAATLQKYGLPSNYNGSNVVLPNGSLDGWGTIGCNVSDDAVHRKVRTTIGGAHCVDMYPYTQNTPGSVENSDVINTINLVRQEVGYYVNLTGPFGNSPSSLTSSSTGKTMSVTPSVTPRTTSVTPRTASVTPRTEPTSAPKSASRLNVSLVILLSIGFLVKL